MFDLVIKNGFVADPQQKKVEQLQVGIKDGKIASVSDAELDGKKILDASGMVVSPGFIDIHMHEDPLKSGENGDYIEEDIFHNMARMGVTTCIGGNCGIGIDDVDRYLNAVDQCGLPVNFGTFMGYSALREKAGIADNYRPLEKEEILRVKELIRKGLAAGAIGLSYGLEYTPGSTTNEIMETAKVLKEYEGKLMSAHYRLDADEGIESIKELIYISWVTGVPMQISHIGSCTAFGMMRESLKQIELARSIGIDVMADCYPYHAFSTGIGTAVFDGDCFTRWGKDFGAIYVSEGKYAGQYCTKEIFEYLREKEPETLVVAFVMDDREVDRALSHPLVMFASDGLINMGQGHPRSAGAFPRILGKHVREKGLLPLIDALEKMTIVPAKRLGLENKGVIRAGKDADLVIFDPQKICDCADFSKPCLPPEGISYVIVNGMVVSHDGKLSGERPGRAIRFGV